MSSSASESVASTSKVDGLIVAKAKLDHCKFNPLKIQAQGDSFDVGIKSNRDLFRQHAVARPLCRTPGLIVADDLIDALARAARWTLDLFIITEIFGGFAEPESILYEYHNEVQTRCSFTPKRGFFCVNDTGKRC